MRAMLPSSRMTSQMTARLEAGERARSTLPSVCPARSRTPPSLARRGRYARGDEVVGGGAVGHGSQDGGGPVKGEMPVETPTLASMDTVNPVPKGDLC